MAEIIAKLGLDDTKFDRGLQGASRKATGILGTLQRKFSSVDLFKDTLKGIGLGVGAGAIAERVVSFFSRGATQAKAMADHSEAMVDIQRTLQGALGGPRRELELQVKHVNELNRDIEDQKRLLESLKNDPLELLSPGYAEQVDEAQAKLDALVQKQSQLSAGAQAAAHSENQRTAALQRQAVHEDNMATLEERRVVEGQKFAERKRALEAEYVALQKQGALPSALQENRNRQAALQNERKAFYRNENDKQEDLKRTARLEREMSAAELRDASEVEKKQIRLNGLRREYDVIKKRIAIGSPEAEANRNEQRRLQNDIKIDQKTANRNLVNTLAGVGDSVAGKLGTMQPRPRGRSERERIADRARTNIIRAEEAVRTGGNPNYIARLTKSAAADLNKVGGKIEGSTSKVSKADADATGSPLLQTNSLLKEIRDNLKPTNTGGGSKK